MDIRYHCGGIACASVTSLRRGHLGQVVSGAQNGQAPTVGRAPAARRWSGSQKRLLLLWADLAKRPLWQRSFDALGNFPTHAVTLLPITINHQPVIGSHQPVDQWERMYTYMLTFASRTNSQVD